jgi:hypothetical protein
MYQEALQKYVDQGGAAQQYETMRVAENARRTAISDANTAERAKLFEPFLDEVKSALRDKSFSVATAKKLHELELLTPSTSFRSCSQFPGEASVFRYNFKSDGVEHFGMIGFDQKFNLISVDERRPVERSYYAKEKALA